MTKTTRRAFLSSVVALVICLTMLIGTTFAWFTDTASTAVNTIQSGKLNVALEMKNDEGLWESVEGKTIDFVKAEGHEDEEILWEPGCTYYTNDFRISNTGNLALKFKVVVSGTDGDAKLNEAIDWYVLNARDNEDYNPDDLLSGKYIWSWTNINGEEKYSALDDEFYLLPGECVYLKLMGEMDSEAGNDYQGLTLDGIAITVYATQYTYEYDSTTNQYDADAEYPDVKLVSNDEELAEALNSTDKNIDIVLTGDVEVTVDSGTQWTNAFGGANTETITIDGLGTYTLTINQPDSDWSHVATNGAKLVLKNLKLTNSGYNNGPWNQHDINFCCEVELDNVVSDKAIALYKNSTLNNVKITDDSSNVYGLWITADGQTVNLNNVEISTNRAIAIKDQYRETTSQKVTLNITDSKFTSVKKAAVLVTSKTGATITASNVDISGVEGDSTNLVWIDNGAGYSNISDTTVTGATVVVES